MTKFSNNNSIIAKIVNNPDDIAELISLNNYIDEIKFEHQQNLISTQEHKNEINIKLFQANHNLLRKVKIASKSFGINIFQSCDIFFSILYFFISLFLTFTDYNIKSTIINLAKTSKQVSELLALMQTSNLVFGVNKNQFPNKFHSLVQNYHLIFSYSINSTRIDSNQFSRRNDFISIY